VLEQVPSQMADGDLDIEEILFMEVFNEVSSRAFFFCAAIFPITVILCFVFDVSSFLKPHSESALKTEEFPFFDQLSLIDHFFFRARCSS